VGNLITFHLEQELHCIISMSLEIIITLTCPGTESALGLKCDDQAEVKADVLIRKPEGAARII